MNKHHYMLSDEVVYDQKPQSIAHYYRLSFRVALTCLIIKCTCGREACSLLKIHFFSNYLYSNENMRELKGYLEDPLHNFLTLRIDPTVNTTLEYMLADGIIKLQANGLYKLTPKGNKLTKQILQDTSLLENVRTFLSSLPFKIDDDYIKKISSKLLG